jgi:hypothetical protein
MKELIEDLVIINCKNHFKVRKDGKCYSKTCMLNTNPALRAKIKAQGCLVYKAHK